MFGKLKSLFGQAEQNQELPQTRIWLTDQGKLFDSDEFLASLKRVVKGNIIGTDSKFDTHAVANGVVDLVINELAEPVIGTQTETALTALGALSGFSAQMAIREYFVRTGKVAADKAFVEAKTKKGETFFFGDLLNEPLITNNPGNLSVWRFVAGAAQHLGATELPDMQDLFRHVTATVGNAGFGIPRLPADHMPHATPFQLLDRFWNPVRNYHVSSVDNPGSWPFSLGLAAQLAMIRAKDVIDATLAATIVMEAAVPMSKIDPTRIYRAYF